MNILYPSEPFDSKIVDQIYSAEYEVALECGHRCFLFPMEDFEVGEFKTMPLLPANEAILYRGWMLELCQYRRLVGGIRDNGAIPFTEADQYELCHYLPNWYSFCDGITPKTVFAEKETDFEILTKLLGWDSYFVKDYVKSLTTTRGSIAKDAEEIREVVSLIEKFRGKIEGGVCLRQVEELAVETEERYFVFRGQPHGRLGEAPDVVKEISTRIESPFYSVDVVLNDAGVHRVVELGDGQVSDVKNWPVDRFISILKGA